MITIGKENYKKYGECISMTNGTIKMLITKDLGPRIIFYGINGKNIMGEDLEDTTNKGGEFFETNFPGEGIWHLYGGHRLWKSPEYLDTYYPDNKEVDVKYVGNNCVRFISKSEKTTKLQKIIQVTMNENGSAEIKHEMTNMATIGSAEFSAWGLTVLDKGAVSTIPLSTENTVLLPNRNVVFWSYTDIKDERFTFNADKLIVKQTPKKEPFKIGVYTTQTIQVKVNGMDFTISVDQKDGDYPDYSCNVECYTNNHIMEIETLSPLRVLRPGETLCHTERWTLK